MIRILVASGALALAVPLATPARVQETFHGYDSGHEAGYDRAARNDITDERDCDADSRSFNEGCQACVKEQADNAKGNRQSDDENDNADDNE